MSYDYSLFKAPGEGPMSSWTAAPLASLGSIEDVKQRIRGLFAESSWREFNGTWFGRAYLEGGIEFQITPETDGSVRYLTVRHIARHEVEALCRALGVIAVDGQKMEVIRPS